jgi:hypothetical protein
MNAKCSGQTNNILQGQVALASLHSAHVRAMNASFGRKRLLAQAGSLAQEPDTIAETPESFVTHWSRV